MPASPRPPNRALCVSLALGAALALVAHGGAARADAPAPAASADSPTTPATTPASAPAPRWAIEAGGLVSAGLDATDATTRQGGAYAGATVWATPRVPIALRYTVASGFVTDRVAAPSPDGSSPVLDARSRQTRQSFDLGVAWRFDLTEGREIVYVAPSVGPRATWLTDAVSPLWTFEGEGLLTLGVRAPRAWDARAFAGYARSLARASSPPSIHGALVAESRFGATVSTFASPNFAVSLGYEGDVVTLEHQSLTYHQLLLGLSRTFD